MLAHTRQTAAPSLPYLGEFVAAKAATHAAQSYWAVLRAIADGLSGADRAGLLAPIHGRCALSLD